MKTSRIIIIFLLIPFFSYAAEDVENTGNEIILSPVIVDGTPADALKIDPILPSTQGKTTQRASNGGIAKDIANQLPYHLSDNSKAGNVVSMSGNTRTAEEFDVNVLGIPLNAPQGGGYNLTSFPQYLWSGFHFQLGPSMGAYDPRAIAGSLSLKLWTQEALLNNERETRVTGFHSTTHVQQFSAGVDTGKKSAVNIGFSTGKTQGPAGSLSTRLFEGEHFKTKFHLIATNQKVIEFQSERTSQATADYTTMRIIPIFQVDQDISSHVQFKSSLFWDHTYLKTDDPTNLMSVQRERSHTRQGGLETALLIGNSRLGIGLRQTDFKRLTFKAPTEKLMNLQFTHSIKNESLLIEPTLGGTAVTRIGFKPMASLGIRHEKERAQTVQGTFLRLGYHHRFPSILDRYTIYKIPGFMGPPYAVPNPDLAPERVFSSELGSDFKSDDLKVSLTGFARYSKDARFYRDANISFAPPPPTVIRSAQVINYKNAYTFGAMYDFNYDVLSTLTLGAKVNWTKARYKQAHQDFLYQPEWVGITSVGLHDALKKFNLLLTHKTATRFLAGSEDSVTPVSLPSYTYFDAMFGFRLNNSISFSTGVENVLNRKIELRKNQPISGRIWTLSAMGVF